MNKYSPNTAWNEPRIWSESDFDGTAKENWEYIKENDRLIKAYVEKYGLLWKELEYSERYALRDEYIEKAKEEGL